MKSNRFINLTDEELARTGPRNESEEATYEWEKKFRSYCSTHEIDPMDEGNREEFEEVCAETDGFWDNLDANELEGWSNYMTKDFD